MSDNCVLCGKPVDKQQYNYKIARYQGKRKVDLVGDDMRAHPKCMRDAIRKGDLDRKDHEPECRIRHATALLVQAEYDKQWPKACHRCSATGTIGADDPCPECAEKGLCARCGEKLPDDFWDMEGKPCPYCGTLFGAPYTIEREYSASGIRTRTVPRLPSMWHRERRPEVEDCYCKE